jgi:acetyl-CoA carboxylase carboxyltransferase component
MRGVVPQVAAVMGPCAADMALIPGLADFVPMVAGRGSMALAGPEHVRAAIGEQVTAEQLGGAHVHARRSGVADLEAAGDEECLADIRAFLAYLPSHCGGEPPRRPVRDPVERSDEELLDVLGTSLRAPFDMDDVIRRIVDDAELLELKAGWARRIITALARLGGRPAGIVASRPRHFGGVLDADAADKAARFVTRCDAFGLPLVFLQDVPGFMVGPRVEAAGLIRHAATLLDAVANATVPKLTVVLRRAHGAGYHVMCGRASEPDLIVAWPGAEIAVMGAEGAVEVLHRAQLEATAPEERDAVRAGLVAAYREVNDVAVAARNGVVDDVIDPRETRSTLVRALARADGKGLERRRRADRVARG